MKVKGKFKAVSRDILSGRIILQFDVEPFYLGLLDDLNGQELSIEVKKYSRSKTNAQNALFWECIGQLAAAQKLESNLELYRRMIRNYGVYTYAVVNPAAVPKFRAEFRDIEELGEIEIDGRKGIQLICYIGCSHYTVEEYSRLIDGIIKEMIAEGLNPPTTKEIERALAACKK